MQVQPGQVARAEHQQKQCKKSGRNKKKIQKKSPINLKEIQKVSLCKKKMQVQQPKWPELNTNRNIAQSLFTGTKCYSKKIFLKTFLCNMYWFGNKEYPRNTETQNTTVWWKKSRLNTILENTEIRFLVNV